MSMEPRPLAHWLRLGALGALVVLVISSPWWGPRALSGLDFFRVRKVEIEGARYLAPEQVLARLQVDTTVSVWTDLAPLEERVAAHPQVRVARVERKLPGTLVVHVTENLPIALVPAARGLRAVDVDGDTLPIDPSAVDVDLPIVAQRDTAVLRLLAEVRTAYPALFDRISAVRRVGRGELLVQLTSVPVRALASVSVERLAEVVPVERDLERRSARVAELDLRYRDQVIARLQ
jgi:cell division protein FtsQ